MRREHLVILVAMMAATLLSTSVWNSDTLVQAAGATVTIPWNGARASDAVRMSVECASLSFASTPAGITISGLSRVLRGNLQAAASPDNPAAYIHIER